ncbi:replicative DNA helicase [Rhodoferax sp. GW822-FHT02A01]|uniref:replicative DNA helicase n=1 Tax=Rhodoferax sp. GW822-FHT02A01 TaxID=3141537 RepID=UPI00315DB7A0
MNDNTKYLAAAAKLDDYFHDGKAQTVARDSQAQGYVPLPEDPHQERVVRSQPLTQSRSLPWSVEAEQSVIGSLLIDPDAISRVVERQLVAQHFFDLRHRCAMSAIFELAAQRKPVDVVTVFAHLSAQGKGDDCGGIQYLDDVASSVPSASRVGAYADIVIEKALHRSIINAADKALTIAWEPGEAGAALDKVASLFATIKRSRSASSPVRLGELVVNRLDHWQSLAAGDTLPGVPTGLASLDDALGGGIKPGKVIVLAARPSVGKTSLAGQISLSVASQGHTVLMLSQEMPAGDLVDRAVANLGAVNLDHLTTGNFENEDWSHVTEAAEAASKIPFYVDDQPALTLLDIRAKARQVQQRDGLVLLVVDYLQLCSSPGKFDKRHHQIEEISRGMKTLAKELGICVMVLSQLNRESDKDEPELVHLKESGAIEEDADVVIMLHPMGNESDGGLLVLAKIPKNRQGRRGRLALSLHGKTQQWRQSVGNVARRPKREFTS